LAQFDFYVYNVLVIYIINNYKKFRKEMDM